MKAYKGLIYYIKWSEMRTEIERLKTGQAFTLTLGILKIALSFLTAT